MVGERQVTAERTDGKRGARSRRPKPPIPHRTHTVCPPPSRSRSPT